LYQVQSALKFKGTALSTLATRRIDTFPRRFVTVAELAELLGTSRRWVERGREIGVIVPRYTKGEVQFAWGAIHRLELFRMLLEVMGSNSGLPAKIVRKCGPEIDRLAEQQEPLLLYDVEASAAITRAIFDLVFGANIERELFERVAELGRQERERRG
jgi:hypothetical protein